MSAKVLVCSKMEQFTELSGRKAGSVDVVSDLSGSLIESIDTRVDWQMFNITPNDKQLIDLVLTYGESFPKKDSQGHILARSPSVQGKLWCLLPP